MPLPRIPNRRRPNPTWLKEVTRKQNSKTLTKINKYKKKRHQVTAVSNKSFVSHFLRFLVISLSFLACSYQTYDRLHRFLSEPIETKVTLTCNSSVKFPSITFCPGKGNFIPLVELRKQKAKERNRKSFCHITPFALLNDTLNISPLWSLMSFNGTLEDFFERSRRRGKKTGKSVLFSVNTDTKTIFGTCHTYSCKNLVRFRKDFLLAFRFTTDLTLLCKPISNSTYKPIISRFMLHTDEDDITYKIAAGYKFQAIPNMITYGLTAKRFINLNLTKNPCNTKKVVSDCQKNCFESALKNITKCRLPLVPVSEVPPCANENDSVAADKQLLDLALGLNFIEECNCPRVCDDTKYTDHFGMITISNESGINFFFEDNMIEEIEEHYSYSFISFICDCGGNLGLFLGLSIPAMFDLAEAFVTFTTKKITSLKHI